MITVDGGITTLGKIAAQDKKYDKVLFPYLLEHLRTCRPKSVPADAERMLPAVNDKNRIQFVNVLNQRLDEMSGSQLARVKKVLRSVGTA